MSFPYPRSQKIFCGLNYDKLRCMPRLRIYIIQVGRRLERGTKHGTKSRLAARGLVKSYVYSILQTALKLYFRKYRSASRGTDSPTSLCLHSILTDRAYAGTFCLLRKAFRFHHGKRRVFCPYIAQQRPYRRGYF